jgi:hypothetical protein
MNHQGTQTLPHPPERVWQALLDLRVLSACIAGSEGFERAGENACKGRVTVAAGPLAPRVEGTLAVVESVALERCTLQFSGEGGGAGVAEPVRGECRVELRRAGVGATRLDWSAQARVGGGLAEIGAGPLASALRGRTEDFFLRFAAQLNGAPVVAAETQAAAAPAGLPWATPKLPGPPVKGWARAVAVALGGGMVYWLCFKG